MTAERTGWHNIRGGLITFLVALTILPSLYVISQPAPAKAIPIPTVKVGDVNWIVDALREAGLGVGYSLIRSGMRLAASEMTKTVFRGLLSGDLGQLPLLQEKPGWEVVENAANDAAASFTVGFAQGANNALEHNKRRDALGSDKIEQENKVVEGAADAEGRLALYEACERNPNYNDYLMMKYQVQGGCAAVLQGNKAALAANAKALSGGKADALKNIDNSYQSKLVNQDQAYVKASTDLVTQKDGSVSEPIKRLLRSICSPNPNLFGYLLFGFGRLGLQDEGGAYSACKPLEAIANWQNVIKNTSTGLNAGDINGWKELERMVQPDATDLGFAFNFSIGEYQVATYSQDTAEKQRQEEYPIKSVKEFNGTIQTPGTLVHDQLLASYAKGEKVEDVITGHIVADAVGTFVDTVIGTTTSIVLQGINKLAHPEQRVAGQLGGMSLLANSPNAILYNPTAGVQYGGVAEANVRLAAFDKLELLPNGSQDILAQLATQASEIEGGCASGRPNVCVISKSVAETIRQSTTVGEAIATGKLSESAIFGFEYPQLSGEATEPSFENNLPYRSLVILRKYRVIPVSWELAALYIRDHKDACGGSTCTLGYVMRNFNTAGSPFYRMIDASWVLKLPPVQCNLNGYGSQILSEICTDSTGKQVTCVSPEYTNQEVSISRKQYCADEQTCIEEDAQGRCKRYGYCLEDKQVLRLSGTQCDAKYVSCKAFTEKSTGKSLYLLDDSRDRSNNCNENNIGCHWVSTTRNSVDPTQAIQREWSPTSRTFLSGQTKGLACDESAEGCTHVKNELKQDQYIRVAPDYMGCGVGSTKKECADFVQACDQKHVGCVLFNEAEESGGKERIATSLIGSGGCPAACAGMTDYIRMPTTASGGFDATQATHLSVIPSTAQRCSAQEVGCEEFTSVNTGGGAEGRQYFASIQQCVKKTAAIDSDPESIFYSIYGSDQGGYRVEKVYLVSQKVGAIIAPACANGGRNCFCDKSVAGQKSWSGGYCREYVSATPNGDATYAYTDKVIYYTDDCTQYRRTIGGQAYFASPSRSNACTVKAVGCHEYHAPEAGNYRIVFFDDFQNKTNSNWLSADQQLSLRTSNEALDFSNISLALNAPNATIVTGAANVQVQPVLATPPVGGQQTVTPPSPVVVTPPAPIQAVPAPTPPAQAANPVQAPIAPTPPAQVAPVQAPTPPVAVPNPAGIRNRCANGFKYDSQRGVCVRSNVTAAFLFGESAYAAATVPFQIKHDIPYVLGKSYVLEFDVKTKNGTVGAGNTQITARIDAGNIGHIDFDSVTTTQQDWEHVRFTYHPDSGVVLVSGTLPLILNFRPASASAAVYVDNMFLREASGIDYFVDGKWSTPNECKNPATGLADARFNGCRLYTDTQNNTQAFKSVERLCPVEVVGCRAFQKAQPAGFEGGVLEGWVSSSAIIEGATSTRYLTARVTGGRATLTKNVSLEKGKPFWMNFDIKRASATSTITYTVSGLSQTENLTFAGVSEWEHISKIIDTIDLSSNRTANIVLSSTENFSIDNIEIPGRNIYAVDDEKKYCRPQDNKCTAFGVPSLNGDTVRMSEDGKKELWSTAYYKIDLSDTSSIAGRCVAAEAGCSEYGGNTYFRDPGKKICYWGAPSNTVEQLANPQGSWVRDLCKPAVGKTYADVKVACSVGSDCLGNALLDSKGICVKAATLCADGDYATKRDGTSGDGWMQQCTPAARDCRLITDPECRLQASGLYELQSNYGKGTQHLSCTPNYYVLADVAKNSDKCEGVNVDTGCLLFKDSSVKGIPYSSSGYYSAFAGASASVNLGDPRVATSTPDANVILKARTDRQCKTWLQCTSKIIDENNRQICTKLQPCQEVDAKGKCIKRVDLTKPSFAGFKELVTASSTESLLSLTGLSRPDYVFKDGSRTYGGHDGSFQWVQAQQNISATSTVRTLTIGTASSTPAARSKIQKSCRLYSQTSKRCDFVDDTKNGSVIYGYCLEPYPDSEKKYWSDGKPSAASTRLPYDDYCLNWYPVDRVQGQANLNANTYRVYEGPQDLNYCLAKKTYNYIHIGPSVKRQNTTLLKRLEAYARACIGSDGTANYAIDANGSGQVGNLTVQCAAPDRRNFVLETLYGGASSGVVPTGASVQAKIKQQPDSSGNPRPDVYDSAIYNELANVIPVSAIKSITYTVAGTDVELDEYTQDGASIIVNVNNPQADANHPNGPPDAARRLGWKCVELDGNGGATKSCETYRTNSQSKTTAAKDIAGFKAGGGDIINGYRCGREVLQVVSNGVGNVEDTAHRNFAAIQPVIWDGKITGFKYRICQAASYIQGSLSNQNPRHLDVSIAIEYRDEVAHYVSHQSTESFNYCSEAVQVARPFGSDGESVPVGKQNAGQGKLDTLKSGAATVVKMIDPTDSSKSLIDTSKNRAFIHSTQDALLSMSVANTVDAVHSTFAKIYRYMKFSITGPVNVTDAVFNTNNSAGTIGNMFTWGQIADDGAAVDQWNRPLSLGSFPTIRDSAGLSERFNFTSTDNNDVRIKFTTSADATRLPITDIRVFWDYKYPIPGEYDAIVQSNQDGVGVDTGKTYTAEHYYVDANGQDVSAVNKHIKVVIRDNWGIVSYSCARITDAGGGNLGIVFENSNYGICNRNLADLPYGPQPSYWRR